MSKKYKKAKKTKLDNKMFRQGDLLFIPCQEIPKDAVEQPDGIVARGESTGHMHRIADTQRAMLYMLLGNMYIKARYETEVKHEEHKPIILPPGEWKIKRQREYQPDGWKQVAD
jgi:hypothetical protein